MTHATRCVFPCASQIFELLLTMREVYTREYDRGLFSMVALTQRLLYTNLATPFKTNPNRVLPPKKKEKMTTCEVRAPVWLKIEAATLAGHSAAWRASADRSPLEAQNGVSLKIGGPLKRLVSFWFPFTKTRAPLEKPDVLLARGSRGVSLQTSRVFSHRPNMNSGSPERLNINPLCSLAKPYTAA